jgi:acyl-CoA reductase-like NAD-dependent aldehyde dehydrogenase
VLCITPFNFPINIALHKIGPAIAAGNTVLFKPGPQNTASSQLLVKLCYEAGIPQDVLQLSVPALEDMSRLVAHDDISAVNFTGGTAAANAIAAAAGYKKLLLELGGNDPLIVMPDGDLEAAVAAAINQRFATAGQRCTAAKRLFIHGDVYDRFRDLLVQKSTALKVGDPMDDDTFVGPVIHSGAAAEIRSRIEDAIEKGATVALGNRYEGAFVYPTILENVSTDCELMVEETFGPVMPLCRFTDVEDIIPVINNTAYGLQAGIFTQNLGLVRYLFEQLDVGTLACNDGPGFRTEHFPFGGVKQSGVGREGIKYAVREMSVVKTLVI